MGRLLRRNNENELYCTGTCTAEKCDDCYHLGDILEKLAHYEDLEEAGRLVELPCKVGEIVYKLLEYSQYRFIIKKKHFYYNDIPDFGKTVFLTGEEAEAALKGAE